MAAVGWSAWSTLGLWSSLHACFDFTLATNPAGSAGYLSLQRLTFGITTAPIYRLQCDVCVGVRFVLCL